MSNDATLHFFSAIPDNFDRSPLIASSLQALETSFFLIAFRRYPHAMTTCGAAIESALQAADVGATDRDGLQILFKKAKEKSLAVRDFETEKSIATINSFRNKRNDFTHRGFSPHDDAVASRLYIDVGLELLALCYLEFHGFDLMRNLRPSYRRQIDAIQTAYQSSKGLADFDSSTCLHGLGYLVRREFSLNGDSKASFEDILDLDELDRVEDNKRNFSNFFDTPW